MPCTLFTICYASYKLLTSWRMEPVKVLRDAEIFALAIPALFSVLLDPLLSLVDTGGCGFLLESHEAAVMGCLC